MGDACIFAMLLCMDIFMHEHFACYALLDLFASELLQDGGMYHTGTRMTKQKHYTSHACTMRCVIIPE